MNSINNEHITVDDKLRFRMKWISIFGWLSVFTVIAGIIGWFANAFIDNPANKLNPSDLWGIAIPLFGAVGGLFWTHSATTPTNTIPVNIIPNTETSIDVTPNTKKEFDSQVELPREPID